MGGWEDGRMGGSEEGGRERLDALGSGWFRFRVWFVFCFGWSVGGSRLGCLAGLVWFGWLYSCLGEVLLLVLFLSVRLFVRFVLYTVYRTRFCLVFARF